MAQAVCVGTWVLTAWIVTPVDATGQERLSIRGTVVDDETGEPVTDLMIQAGRIDPDDPEKITWGFSETRTSSKTGAFRTNVDWSGGWTARIVADGYQPHPVITESPAVGAREITVEIRLKRGTPVKGRLVNHDGEPVADAMVFAVGPRGINLYQGNAHQSYDDSIDRHAKGVSTDDEGRFEIFMSGSERIAISSKQLDAHVFRIDEVEAEETEFKLPAPASVKITVDIEGADEETEIFYQFLTHLEEDYKRVESTRSVKVANGESIELNSLPPGKYQFCRNRMHHYENVGNGAMIDRTWVELKPGETTELNFVRTNAKPVTGMVRWPESVKLSGIILSINAIDKEQPPWGGGEYATKFDSQLVAGKPQVAVIEGNEASFKTEAMEPGRYMINVSAYRPMTAEEMRFSGIRGPDFVATKEIVVTEEGEVNMLSIELEAVERR